MTFSDAVSSAISEREWLDTTTGQSAVELLQNNFPLHEVVRRVISASVQRNYAAGANGAREVAAPFVAMVNP